MKRRFADTVYYLALLSLGDQHHRKAIAFSKKAKAQFVTTEYVLNEVANNMCATDDRRMYVALAKSLAVSPETVIVPASPDLWKKGNDLYAARPDKEWSLTDCISFVVMEERKLTEALTADHHFTQAGFVALLA